MPLSTTMRVGTCWAIGKAATRASKRSSRTSPCRRSHASADASSRTVASTRPSIWPSVSASTNAARMCGVIDAASKPQHGRARGRRAPHQRRRQVLGEELQRRTASNSQPALLPLRRPRDDVEPVVRQPGTKQDPVRRRHAANGQLRRAELEIGAHLGLFDGPGDTGYHPASGPAPERSLTTSPARPRARHRARRRRRRR